MFYATGYGNFGEGTMKTQQQICRIISKGGGYPTTAQQECFKAFMLEQGCGMDQSCESCEAVLQYTCNCSEQDMSNANGECTSDGLFDCGCNNFPETCQYQHPVLTTYPSEGRSPRTGVCPGDKTPSGLPKLIKCNLDGGETANSLAAKWKQCAQNALNRCNTLQQCVDNLPDSSTCENINNRTEENNTSCLQRACGLCDGGGQFGGHNFPSGAAPHCYQDNQIDCQEYYGPSANAPSIYVPFECDSLTGCDRYFCDNCFRTAYNSNNPVTIYCINTEVFTSCDDISVAVLKPIGEALDFPAVRNGIDFSDYWEEVVSLWCQTPEGAQTAFKDPDSGEWLSACQHRDDGFFGCNDTCEAARLAIERKINPIARRIGRSNVLCSFYGNLSEGELPTPAQALNANQRILNGEMYTARDWCDHRYRSQGSASSPSSPIEDLKNRLKKISS